MSFKEDRRGMDVKKQASRWELPALDGLRGLAILLVVWCHLGSFGQAAGLPMGPRWVQVSSSLGSTGVMLFFVLSGFLLFTPYARALLHGSPWPSTRQFYRRRALRILPAYLVFLACIAVLSRQYTFSPSQRGPLALMAVLLQDLDPAAYDLSSRLNGPLWSLTVEWQFYFLLPFIALALSKLSGPANGRSTLLRLAAGLAMLILIGVGIRELVAELHYAGGYAMPSAAPGLLGLSLRLLYGMIGKFWEIFALGMLASVFYVALIEPGGIAERIRRRLALASISLALAGGLVFALWIYTRQQPLFPTPAQFLFPADGQGMLAWGDLAVATGYMLLVLAVLLGNRWLNRVFTWKPLRWIGLISYSMYLWHYVLIHALVSQFSPGQPLAFLSFVLVALVMIVPWSASSYYLTERPFLRWRRAKRASLKLPVMPSEVEAPVQPS